MIVEFPEDPTAHKVVLDYFTSIGIQPVAIDKEVVI